MRWFLPNIHGELTRSFARAAETLGATLLVPGRSFYEGPEPLLRAGHPSVPEGRGARLVEVEELLDAGAELLFVPAHEVESTILDFLAPRLPRMPFVAHFAGNELPHFDYGRVSNLLSADLGSYRLGRRLGVHAQRYFPWIDYDHFAFEDTSGASLMRAYIMEYPDRYPRDLAQAHACVSEIPGLRFEARGDIPLQDLPSRMRETSATLHFKPKEGYGYSVLQSLAVGRPVVLWRSYARKQTLAEWCIDGVSALMISSRAEFRDRVGAFLRDEKSREGLQREAARVVRSRVDNEAETEHLRLFIERLRPTAPPRRLRRISSLLLRRLLRT